MELSNLVYGGFRTYDSLPSPTRTTFQVWGSVGIDLLNLIIGHPITLCGVTLHYLTQVWESIGNNTLQDIMPAGMLLPFQDLSSMYRLPGWMHFRYLQLAGSAQFQFPHPPVLETDPTESLALLCVDSSKIDNCGDSSEELIFRHWTGRTVLRATLNLLFHLEIN